MEYNAKYGKWIKTFFVVLLAAGAVLLSVRSERNDQKHIVLILKTIDDSTDFWTSMIDGANTAAKEHEVLLTVMGTGSETEYEEQGEMIREAIALKPDAIALTPANYTETIPYAELIEEAGIELVLVDSVMEKEMGSCVVATDNVEAGRKMGAFIRENCDEIREIGIVGHVKGSSTATEREEGLRKGLDDLQERISSVTFCDSDYRKAYKVTKQMLTEFPEINVIAGLNEYSSVGVARAVIDLGLEDEIFLVGFDSSITEVEFLESEIFSAIVVQKPWNMGYLAIENTLKLLEKEDVTQYIDSGSALITKETMYAPENQKLLFPF